MAKKTLVIGAGNPLFGDDALGYCVARLLEECVEGRAFDVLALQALEPGVVAYFEGYETVIFVDAVDPASLPEGAKMAVYELDPKRLDNEELVSVLSELSSHESNPLNLAVLGYAAGTLSRNARIALVGLRPYRIELGAGGLSSEACRLALDAAGRVAGLAGGGVLNEERARRLLESECGCREPL